MRKENFSLMSHSNKMWTFLKSHKAKINNTLLAHGFFNIWLFIGDTVLFYWKVETEYNYSVA